MATWKRILTEADVKDRTLNVMLAQTSITGVEGGHVNFLRPNTMCKVGNTNAFPSLEFSDDQSQLNKDIKKWSSNSDLTGSDTDTAYFSLAGDMSMDSDYNDNAMTESLMGCAFAVPMGRKSTGFHYVEFNFLVSHEGGEGESSGIGEDYWYAYWKPTIWRAYVDDETTIAGGNATHLKFRLVSGDGSATYSGDNIWEPGAALQWQYVRDEYPNLGGIPYRQLRLPLHSDDEDWTGKTCYYMVGFHNLAQMIDPDPHKPHINSFDFPSVADPVSGNKQCTITANFRVTYRAN